MADIKPFRGYRYRLANPRDLDKLIAPPYDMLDKGMVEQLYSRDPHNTVRITQNKPQDSDTCNRDRHVRASAHFEQWVSQGVIARDEELSIYIYEQSFQNTVGKYDKTVERTGITVLVKLVDFEDGVVLPHEYTLSGPKQDRYELLEASRLNTGQIFGLLSDEGDAYSVIRSLKGAGPEGVSTDENGVRHKLYRCTDRQKIGLLVEMVKDRTILIADGHHRYETALKFARDHGGEENAYIMMTLVSMADPGLIIRPFHRLIRKVNPAIDMKAGLSSYFKVDQLGIADKELISSFLSGGVDAGMIYIDSSDRTAYGLKLSQGGESLLGAVEPEHSNMWKHLDVSTINLVAIGKILDLPLDGKVLHDVVEYVNNPTVGLQLLTEETRFYGGFFIRPISISTIQQIVEGGERMPQKSTNFYPKLYSGLVFNKLEQ